MQTQVKSSVPVVPVPSQGFSNVHIDIVGPLPTSQNFSYILTMIELLVGQKLFLYPLFQLKFVSEPPSLPGF